MLVAMDATSHVHWPDGQETLVLGVAGGSGSGKTTLSEALVRTVGLDDVAVLEHDAYYWHRPELSFEERARVNYDHPDAFETDLIIRHIEDLRNGRAVEKPIYDYSHHLRTNTTTRVKPAPVILVEGILVLAEPALRDLMDLKIFVDTDADVRLVRRVRRDVKERGRSSDSVLDQYMGTVRPMHLQFVEPSKRYADIIIPEGYNPSAVGTVISMIRQFLSQR
jgi:uridine kinase